MQDLLIKMARKAANNETLIANFIETYCQKNNTTWVEVAKQLNSTEKQLAKLALCRHPKEHAFAQETIQIAQYTSIDVNLLTTFMQPDSLLSSLKQKLRIKQMPVRQPRGELSMNKRRTITFAIALVAILFVSAFLFNQPTKANETATLRVTTGKAIVTQTGTLGSSAQIVAAGDSITLSTADTIKMADNSTAELFLFEGSQVDLTENSVLELTELTNNETDHQIYMTLFNGRIINRVTKLLGVDDAYEVRTPSSTASVRGTVFSVAVLNDNATEVNVAEGVVEVALGNEVARVHAGEMITAVTSKPLSVQSNDGVPLDPTATPTNEPTDIPPTGEVNEDPTDEPTNEPTDTPTAEESDEPTGESTEPSESETEGEPSNEEEEVDIERGPPTQVPGHTPEDIPGNGNPPTGSGPNPGNGNPPTGGVPNPGNGDGNNGNGDGSNGNNDGTGNDGNNGSGSDNNSNGNNGSNGSSGTGNDGNNGSGSGNSGNGNGSNGSGNGGSNGKP